MCVALLRAKDCVLKDGRPSHISKMSRSPHSTPILPPTLLRVIRLTIFKKETTNIFGVPLLICRRCYAAPIAKPDRNVLSNNFVGIRKETNEN